MTLAVFMDFQVEINRREGITAYAGYLMNSLMENNQDLNLEVWVYSMNTEPFKREYADLMEKYDGRITVFDEKTYPIKKFEIKHFIKYEIFKYFCYFLRFIHHERSEDIGYRASLHYALHQQTGYDLTDSFNLYSNADLSYLPFPGLTCALKTKKPVVIQIHDLFTFPLEKLFNEEAFPRASFTKNNRYVKSILTKYAKKGAYFISSTAYTRDTQILKYIQYSSLDRCRVIPFPPMIKMFNGKDIPSEKDFRKKYNLNYKYIAFPSQNRPNKNLILLLKALKVLNKKGCNLKLVTTGSMRNCNSTADFVKKNKNIVVEIGSLPIEDVFGLYKYAELVVCPNIMEGLGISGQCLEAISVGTPVIHAKSMGMQESLSNVGLDFKSAPLRWVELDDYEGLVKEIKYVLANRENVAKKQEVVLESYLSVTWEDVAKNYMDLFKSICNG